MGTNSVSNKNKEAALFLLRACEISTLINNETIRFILIFKVHGQVLKNIYNSLEKLIKTHGLITFTLNNLVGTYNEPGSHSQLIFNSTIHTHTHTHTH